MFHMLDVFRMNEFQDILHKIEARDILLSRGLLSRAIAVVFWHGNHQDIPGEKKSPTRQLNM